MCKAKSYVLSDCCSRWQGSQNDMKFFLWVPKLEWIIKVLMSSFECDWLKFAQAITVYRVIECAGCEKIDYVKCESAKIL